MPPGVALSRDAEVFMNTSLRCAVCLIALMALVAAAAVPSGWLPPAGPGPAAPSAFASWLGQEETRAAQLQQEWQELMEKMEQKQGILCDLIEERVTLPEALGRLIAVAEADLRLARDNLYPHAAGEDEGLYLVVIFWAEACLRDQPERAEQVRRRLEKQLTACLNKGNRK